MKIIIFAVLFIYLASGQNKGVAINEFPSSSVPDVQYLITRYQMECIEETRINPDVIVNVKNRRWSCSWKEETLLKQWALCMLMRNKVMTKAGVYLIDVALNRVPIEDRDIVESQIDKCLMQKAAPATDIAYDFIKCFQRNESNHSSVVSAFN